LAAITKKQKWIKFLIKKKLISKGRLEDAADALISFFDERKLDKKNKSLVYLRNGVEVTLHFWLLLLSLFSPLKSVIIST